MTKHQIGCEKEAINLQDWCPFKMADKSKDYRHVFLQTRKWSTCSRPIWTKISSFSCLCLTVCLSNIGLLFAKQKDLITIRLKIELMSFADPVHFRPRVCSLPENSRAPYNPRSRDDIYRLRNFSITSKGVVNRGDAIISRHSRSNTSINSTLTA